MAQLPAGIWLASPGAGRTSQRSLDPSCTLWWQPSASCGSHSSAGDRSALYATLPTIAGAELVERTAYDIRDDSGDTGHDGLRVVYRLPAASTAEEVLDELRAGLPDGRSEASDDTCARLAQGALPPPVPTNADGSPGSPPTPPAAATALMRSDTELTAFAPGGEQRERWEGVTFAFVERGDERLLVLDEPELACAPVESDVSRRPSAADGSGG